MKPSALLQQAIELEGRGRIAEALAGYQKVLAREPSNIDALTRLGQTLLQQGELEASAQALRKALTLRPKHAPAHLLLGMLMGRAGHPQDALACFERAVAADPRSDAARIYEADALATLGRAAEAVAAFDKALAINANNVVAWNNRGIALETLGRDADAAASYEHALALQPDLAAAHFSLANALHRLQRYDAAVPHYRKTIALWPDFARAYANLGNTLLELQRWEEALQSLQQAGRRQPNDAKLHQSIGIALRHLERDQECMASFDKALSIEPGNPDIMGSKANALYVQGRFEEARALTEAAAALKPGDTRILLNLSEMKRFSAGDPHIAAMEALLPNLDTRPAEQQIDLHFALAKVYRDLGEAERSFRHLAQGNALKRCQFVYDEASTLASMARIASVFSPELMRSKAGQGDVSKHPIFIIGMPRSGTTLVEQVLASHPRVFGAGEQKKFEQACASLVQPGEPGYPEMVPTLTPAQLKAMGAAYLSAMAPLVGEHDYFTDKLPANYNYAGMIHLALPNARIVHTRRDPIDTCLSCFSVHFAEPPKFASDLAELGRFYRAYEQIMEHWRRVLPEGVMLEVQYEDMVEDIDRQARRIIAHCGLEWDDACLAFYETKRPVRTASVSQVRQPIYRDAVGRWRPYREQLQPLFAALGITAD